MTEQNPPTGQDRAAALLAAAFVLGDAGRTDSLPAIAKGALESGDFPGMARQAFGKAMDAKAFSLAEAIVDAASGPSPRDWPWLPEARTALASRQPFTAAQLRKRLKAIPPRNAAWGGNGPLAYVLHMSLPQNTTGYAIRSHNFIRALGAQGDAVHCLTRPGFPSDLGIEDKQDIHRIDGVAYHRIARPTRREARNGAYVDQAAQALADRLRDIRPHAVMAASNHETAIPALVAARRLGLPFIYDIRGFWELSRAANEPGYAGSPHFLDSVELEGETARQADQVFTLTLAMRDELERRGVARDRIMLLPNAADPDRLRPQPRDNALAQGLGIPAGVPVIGYVGSFLGYEGLEDLVRGCGVLHRRGRDFRLLLVGDDPPHAKTAIGPRLRMLAQEEGIPDKVILPGRVEAREVDRWYSLIDIAPIPRKALAVTEMVSPIKPLEAMAMEKALVVSDLPALLEIVANGVNGLVFPRGDLAGLVDRLEILLADPFLRQRLGRTARQWVVAERSWDRVSRLAHDRLAAIRAGALARRDGPAP